MYHIFLIHSLVKWHLGCFQVLFIMNNAAMRTAEQVSLWYDWESFGYVLKSGIAGFLTFWETAILISKAVVQACTPTSSGRVFPLLHILSSITCHQCFWSWPFWQVWDGISELFVLIYISLMVKDVEHFLKSLLVIWDSSVESSLFRFVHSF